MGEPRLFALRLTTASDSVGVDIEAKAHQGSPPPRDALHAGPRTWLYVLDPLDRIHRDALLGGLRRVADQIEVAVPDVMVVIEVQDVHCSPTDCPPDAVAAAMTGWAVEEFQLTDAV